MWLESCRNNKNFNWVFVTDADISKYEMPSNVKVFYKNLIEIKNIFSETVGFEVSLDSPYKLCDYRPIYWAILERFGLKFDFWGHCDIDLLFGDISKFICDDMYKKYNKILSVGHLSIYRNSHVTNYSYKLDGADIVWRDVYKIKNNIGFDEHHGINKIWIKNKLSIYSNEKIIADVLPGYKLIIINCLIKNRLKQLFVLKNGKILRLHKSIFGYVIEEEFLYIHFQKRKMSVNMEKIPKGGDCIIADDGFYSIKQWPLSDDVFFNFGKNKFNSYEIFNLVKLVFRKIRQFYIK